MKVGNPARGDAAATRRRAGNNAEPRERAGVRGFPFGALKLVPHPLVQHDVVAGAPKGKPRMPARCRTWEIRAMKVSAPARRALMWKEQRRVSGKSSYAALPFRCVRARPTPSRTAGCRGWCTEREAPYTNSLPGACACSRVSKKLKWRFCSMKVSAPARRALTWKEQRRVSGKSSYAALPFRCVRARPTPSRTAGCRGWCTEREAPYTNSLPGACACSRVSKKLKWRFCSMRACLHLIEVISGPASAPPERLLSAPRRCRPVSCASSRPSVFRAVSSCASHRLRNISP